MGSQMSLYDCLDVAPDASFEEIRLAYETHREQLYNSFFMRLFGSFIDFGYVHRYAYEVLSDHKRRWEYDRNPLAFDHTLPEELLP